MDISSSFTWVSRRHTQPTYLKNTGEALQTSLSKSVKKAIENYLQGKKEQILHLDCLRRCKLFYGSINGEINIYDTIDLYLARKL